MFLDGFAVGGGGKLYISKKDSIPVCY